jgi:hypothetical protein
MLEPAIDRIERKLVLRNLLDDKGLILLFGMKALHIPTENARPATASATMTLRPMDTTVPRALGPTDAAPECMTAKSVT